MALIRADAHLVPVTFPVGTDGYAKVTALSLSLRFQFQEESMYLEEEIFDSELGSVTHAIIQLSFRNDAGKMWLLKPGKYRVYGRLDSLLGASTEVLTARESSTSTIHTPVRSLVKLEPGLEIIHELSDDSENEDPPSSIVALPHSNVLHSVSKCIAPLPSRNSCPSSSNLLPSPSQPDSTSVVAMLQKLASRKRSKSVLSRVDYSAIPVERVDFLPPEYNGDVIFKFPPLGCNSTQTVAKQLGGMDKRYDGHAWTRTITSNIMNDVGLSFRTSSCLGHLRCDNVDCDFFTRAHRTTPVNETEWEGIADKPFDIRSDIPSGSTVVCKVCKVPPVCLTTCPAKIYYVVATERMTRACVHLGVHNHLVKVGDYRDFIE